MNLVAKVNEWALANGWTIEEYSPDRKFVMLIIEIRGNPIMVTVSELGDVIEFAAPLTLFPYTHRSQLPGPLSSILLIENSTAKWTFWTVRETSSLGWLYTLMHNARIQDLDAERFAEVVMEILHRVDALEHVLARMYPR